MKPVTLRLHASSLGGRIAALVSSVAGGDALAAATIAAPSIDLLAPAVNQPLGGDPWVPAAYAVEQRWTRDPRGSRVLIYSPRIPHDKVTTWRRPIITLSGGHHRLTEESFNSSLAHKSASD